MSTDVKKKIKEKNKSRKQRDPAVASPKIGIVNDMPRGSFYK